ncbi:RNA polymerase sigma factor OS=Streptomyces antimycoticus OX=68175 GN=SSPO_027620 PE=3 SV=1 [Streptomyces antimycoticus]
MREPVYIGGPAARGPDLEELLQMVARGDQNAFGALYDAVSGPVLGLTRSLLRNPAQAEEVTQEVLVEVWRSAARFEPGRGSAMAWIMTVAHRRAVDRVRSAQAASDREERAALLSRTRRSTR